MSEAAAPSTYLARDYESFRKLLLAHLEAERSGTSALPVASLEVLLVEAMAYMGDYLAYYQDAVGTEAYVATARQRRSLARHGVLLGKTINEGCCARTLVRFETHDSAVTIRQGTQLLTQLPGLETLHIDDELEHDQVAYFSTLHTIVARQEHANMPLAKDQSVFGKSGDSAVLEGAYPHLRAGDFLILFENTTRWQYPVRLVASSVEGETTTVRWLAQDAIPHDALARSKPGEQQWVAHGNLALAQEGKRIALGAPLEFERSSPNAIVRAPMPAFAERFEPSANGMSASRLLSPHPLLAQPEMVLEEKWSLDGPADPSSQWTAARQVLSHAEGIDLSARTFVPEYINNAYISLRFGQGDIAQESGVPLYPSYCESSGSRGNIAPFSLAHLISSDKRIYAATNPLPATGGRDRDTLEEARASLLADCQERGRIRCVSREDYESAASSFSFVADAKVEPITYHKGTREITIRVAPKSVRELSEDMLSQLHSALVERAILSDIVVVLATNITRPYVAVRAFALRGADGAALRSDIKRQLTALNPPMGTAIRPIDVIRALNDLEGLSHCELLHLDLRQASLSAGRRTHVGEITATTGSSIRFDTQHVSIDVVGAV